MIEKLRSYKIFDIAMFDLILGMVGLILLFIFSQQKWFPELDIKSFVLAAILLTIPLGIIFHVLFGIDTALNYKLGLSKKPL